MINVFPAFRLPLYVFITLAMAIVHTTLPAFAAERLDSQIELTQEEEIYIRDNPVIRVHNETDWPPFNFFENGKPQGLSIDYMNLLASKLGIKVEYVTGPTWGEFLDLIKNGDLDVMLNIVKTPEREKYLLYTKSYALNPNSILSLRDTPYDNLEQLFGKTVSLPKGFFYEEILKRDFPQINLHLVRNVEESMKAVIFGKADAALGELAVFNHLKEREMMTNLVLSGEVKLGGSNYSRLNIATRKDEPLLVSILSKAMAGVNPIEVKSLRQRWIGAPSNVSQHIKAKLSVAEEKWIRDNPIVKMAALKDWPPFDFQDEKGRHVGIAAELAKLAASRVGLELSPVFDDWDVLLRKLKAGQLDMVASIYKTPEREQTLEFTDPYLELYDAIFTAETTTDVATAADLNGRIVAVEKGFYTIDLLARSFPDIKLLVVKNTLEALKTVSIGKADAYIGTQYVGSHLIKKYVIPNLKTVGFFGDDPNKIYIATPKRAPILRDIMNKALASISNDEKQEILKKFIILGGAAKQKTRTVNLTAKEKSWLAANQHMRFGVDPGYPPFEFIDEDGVFSGMSSDYIRLISERLGITMELVPDLTWVEVIKGIREGAIDFSPAVTNTPERAKSINFTRPHMAFPVVIISRDDYALIAGLNDLSGSKAALVKEFAVTDIINEKYQGIIANMVDTPLQALQSVASGKSDAAVMNLAVATYLIKKHSLANLKVAAPADIELPGLSFAVRKDWPEFVSILNKALASITPEEESAIRAKWAQVSYNTGINLQLVLQVGGVAAFILIIIIIWNRSLQREVRQRKLAEEHMELAKNEAERLTQAKSDFVAAISHEVRTPMNGVLGMARLLTEMDLDKEQRECVDTIAASGEALITIVNDLLDLSKLDANRLEIENIPFVVDDVVQQTMALMKSPADEKGLLFTQAVDDKIPAVMVGDPHRLRQIILNLISNAVKFTDKGSVVVSAKLESQDSNDAYITFSVRDTGRGIQADALNKLFSKYTQSSVEVARKYGGTGLGLAICRRLADLMGGKIVVESVVGNGSTFSLTLPFAIGRAEDVDLLKDGRINIIQSVNTNVEQAQKPLQVLQAEDNQTNRAVVERVLTRVGHTVTSVENGEQAVREAMTGAYDVVLMDRHMPVMDGLEATRRIRADDGVVASIPIIGITAGAGQDEIAACFDAGMDECLIKPIDPRHLRSLLVTIGSGKKIQTIKKQQATEMQFGAGIDNAEPINLARLAKALDEDDTDVLFNLLGIFNGEFPTLLKRINDAIQNRDATAVHHTTHAAKGASANAAAIRLTELLKGLQETAHLKDWGDIERRASAIATEYDGVVKFCDNYSQQEG